MLKSFYFSIGGDFSEVQSRFPSEQMILRFLSRFREDTTYVALLQAMEDQRYDDAFREVHTLKGIALNLGFSHLGESCHALTEALRPGNPICSGDLLTDLLGNVRQDFEMITASFAKLFRE